MGSPGIRGKLQPPFPLRPARSQGPNFSQKSAKRDSWPRMCYVIVRTQESFKRSIDSGFDGKFLMARGIFNEP